MDKIVMYEFLYDYVKPKYGEIYLPTFAGDEDCF